MKFGVKLCFVVGVVFGNFVCHAVVFWEVIGNLSDEFSVSRKDEQFGFIHVENMELLGKGSIGTASSMNGVLSYLA